MKLIDINSPKELEKVKLDAMRYRWIIKWGYNHLADLYSACNWEPRPGQIDYLIDLELENDNEDNLP